jgi:hypothetical protein
MLTYLTWLGLGFLSVIVVVVSVALSVGLIKYISDNDEET